MVDDSHTYVYTPLPPVGVEPTIFDGSPLPQNVKVPVVLIVLFAIADCTVISTAVEVRLVHAPVEDTILLNQVVCVIVPGS